MKAGILNIFVFWLCTFVSQVDAQCCLQQEDSKCSKCPPDMHLFRGNCIFDTQYCLAYVNGFDCSSC